MPSPPLPPHPQAGTRGRVRVDWQPMDPIEIRLTHYADVVDCQLDPHHVAAEGLLTPCACVACGACPRSCGVFYLVADSLAGHPSIFDKVQNLVYVGPGPVLRGRDDRPRGDALNFERAGINETELRPFFLSISHQNDLRMSKLHMRGRQKSASELTATLPQCLPRRSGAV
jgi:ferredoxin